MSTTVAGRPEEYLRPDWYSYYVDSGELVYQHRLHREEAWPDGSFHPGRPDLEPQPSLMEALGYRAFLDALLPLGTTSNGLFGLKAHRHQLTTALRWMRAAGDQEPNDALLLAHWLPEVRFIYLRREDSIRRAVSHYRALASNVWWRTDDTPDEREVPYGMPTHFDVLEIERLRRKGEEHHRQWLEFFQQAGVDPLIVTYEELSAKSYTVINRVLEHLDIDSTSNFPAEPRLRKQSDPWSDAAVHAYITWRRAQRVLPPQLYGARRH